mmetsp:Transcript_14913/g.33836  ORF Transcript_14913/g.33836 Transcript_14913/m.33836 type:complete len:492 (+) Transcript_14913:186-1661(+)
MVVGPPLPPPTMIPPPPPPPPAQDDDDGEDSLAGDNDSSEEDDDEEANRIDANMETPLIGSRRQPRAAAKNQAFRSQLATCYSSIQDTTTTTTTSGRPTEPSTTHRPAVAAEDTTTDDEDDDDDYSLSGSSISSISTAVMTNFRDNLLLPFVSDETSLNKIAAGMASLTLVGIVLGLVMPKQKLDEPGRWYPWYGHVSSVIGYTYFVLWSVCFYPQVLLNARRRSTRGLSNDFAVLNFMGWSFYSAYLASMFLDPSIRQLYTQRFQNESSTVQSNDVAFSIHAMTLSFVYLLQILYYNSGSLKLKIQTWFLVLGMGLPTIVMPILIWTGIWAYERWLDYFYMLSFFKICCTLTKYSKQVLLNWKRKSTSGWNIWYNFLECSGGTLSMLQIVFDSLNMNDLTGITGNVAKFALGLATIFFDAIFFTQHYILYPDETTTTTAPSHKVLAGSGVPATIVKPSDTLVLSLNSFDEEGTDESFVETDDNESLGPSN